MEMAQTNVRGGQIKDADVTDVDVAAANKDGVAGTYCMRTLGTGAQQAAPGNDSRFTDYQNFIYGVADVRLSAILTEAVPSSDTTTVSTLYLIRRKGNHIGIYNGSIWVVRTFATGHADLALTGLTSGKLYDVFAYWSGTTVEIELGPAWTNDSTRATDLAAQDGIFCKSGDLTRRWVGTIRTTGTTSTTDVAGKRFIWNLYNQEPQQLKYAATGAHSYNGGYREWGGATNRAEFIVGYTQGMSASILGQQANAANDFAIVGLGIDTVGGPNVAFSYMNAAAVITAGIGAPGSFRVAAGYHYLAALQSTASVAATFTDATVSGVVMG